LVAIGTFFTILKYEILGKEKVDSYEEYLGSEEDQKSCQEALTVDPRVSKRGPGNASIIVCNHTGWMEILALIASPVQPGFTPRIENRDVPVLNKLTEGL